MQLLRLFGFLTLVSFCYANIVKVTDENFGSLVNDSDEWILDFYAPWCHHCKSFEKTYKHLDDRIMSSGMNIKLGKVDTDSNPYLAARFFVSRLPTVVHIKDRQGNK
ncbi:thioredoxin-like protein [Phycomyces nitens]|nr:thioredoxin-like protein [Phycomyces nitens]